MDTDAKQEEDAAIHVVVEEKLDDFAQSFPKWPVIALGIIVDQQGQGDDIQKVRDNQVKHVRGGSIPGLKSEQKDVKGQDVENKPNAEHNPIGHRKQNILEIFIKHTLVGVGIIF